MRFTVGDSILCVAFTGYSLSFLAFLEPSDCFVYTTNTLVVRGAKALVRRKE